MKEMFFKKHTAIIFSVINGLLYGVFARMAIEVDSLSVIFSVMSVGFIVVVPFVIGFLTTYKIKSPNVPYRIFMPWLSCVLMVAITWLVGWEGSICIVMALPVFCLFSSIGGLVGGVSYKNKIHAIALPIVLICPPVVSFVESCLELPSEVRIVENLIVVNVPVDVVCNNIKSVRMIDESEHFFNI